jgi:hypothetical protein
MPRQVHFTGCLVFLKLSERICSPIAAGCSSLTGLTEGKRVFPGAPPDTAPALEQGNVWTEGFHKAYKKELLVPPSGFYGVG